MTNTVEGVGNGRPRQRTQVSEVKWGTCSADNVRWIEMIDWRFDDGVGGNVSGGASTELRMEREGWPCGSKCAIWNFVLSADDGLVGDNFPPSNWGSIRSWNMQLIMIWEERRRWFNKRLCGLFGNNRRVIRVRTNKCYIYLMRINNWLPISFIFILNNNFIIKIFYCSRIENKLLPHYLIDKLVSQVFCPGVSKGVNEFQVHDIFHVLIRYSLKSVPFRVFYFFVPIHLQLPLRALARNCTQPYTELIPCAV